MCGKLEARKLVEEGHLTYACMELSCSQYERMIPRYNTIYQI